MSALRDRPLPLGRTSHRMLARICGKIAGPQSPFAPALEEGSWQRKTTSPKKPRSRKVSWDPFFVLKSDFIDNREDYAEDLHALTTYTQIVSNPHLCCLGECRSAFPDSISTQQIHHRSHTGHGQAAV